MKVLDIVLLLACLALLVAGPAMALHELVRAEEEGARAALTGEAARLEPSFRTAWRGALLVGVLVVGALGTLLALRVARQPKVRAVSGRLILVLLAGMTLLDVAFLLDGRYFSLAPYALRAASIVWLYPVAGFLVGGAVLRLIEVESAFSTREK